MDLKTGLRKVLKDKWAKWICTAKVMAMTLLPGKKGKFRPESEQTRALTAAEDGFIHVPEKQLSHFDDLLAALNDRRQLRLLFKGCLASAAPFLLFRLKRRGFSRCQAQATREGIYLSAER